MAYPPLPSTTGVEARVVTAEQRLGETLAKTVHEALQKLTGRQVPFPVTYSAETRARLLQSW